MKGYNNRIRCNYQLVVASYSIPFFFFFECPLQRKNIERCTMITCT